MAGRSATKMLKEKRHRDRKYLDSYRDATCIACGSDYGVIGAHIRTGNEGGMGLKPSDFLTLPLCFSCHQDQENNPGAEWWTNHVLKAIARRRYGKWKNEPIQ